MEHQLKAVKLQAAFRVLETHPRRLVKKWGIICNLLNVTTQHKQNRYDYSDIEVRGASYYQLQAAEASNNFITQHKYVSFRSWKDLVLKRLKLNFKDVVELWKLLKYQVKHEYERSNFQCVKNLLKDIVVVIVYLLEPLESHEHHDPSQTCFVYFLKGLIWNLTKKTTAGRHWSIQQPSN